MPVRTLNPDDLLVESFATAPVPAPELFVTPKSNEPGGCTADTRLATQC
jgi:hypothetical protein